MIRTVGEPRGGPAADHLELAGPLIDMEAGARLSGSRFAYLKGDLVMLELALVRWALERLRAQGFEPVIPPVLVREQALYGTGFLPDTEQQIYSLPEDELYLVGTSEVALASLHAGEILEADALPLRYAGFSSCFRREAGAAGKDTRGIFRVHQFDKVEMFVFTTAEHAAAEHERILAIEEALLSELEIPYRVVNIAVGDLGASAAKKYDCEAWLPEPGALPRADLLLQHDRLPGAPPGDPRARRGRPPVTARHAERHRGRRRPHDHRAAREPPARGPLDRAARVPRRVRRAGRHPRPVLEARLRRAGPRAGGNGAACRRYAAAGAGSSIVNTAPPSGALRGADAAAVGRHDRRDDREAQAGTRLAALAPGLGAPEALEHAVLRALRQARGRGRAPRSPRPRSRPTATARSVCRRGCA